MLLLLHKAYAKASKTNAQQSCMNGNDSWDELALNMDRSVRMSPCAMCCGLLSCGLCGVQVIEGMGELHLDIIVDRLRREFNVECTVGAPQVGAGSAAALGFDACR